MRTVDNANVSVSFSCGSRFPGPRSTLTGSRPRSSAVTVCAVACPFGAVTVTRCVLPGVNAAGGGHESEDGQHNESFGTFTHGTDIPFLHNVGRKKRGALQTAKVPMVACTFSTNRSGGMPKLGEYNIAWS